MTKREQDDSSDQESPNNNEKAAVEVKSGKAGSQFEKNYPKNIFIPVIEHLADLGLKYNYEQCVGTREQFQGKNVVSLSLFYELLSSEWFQRNVNKTTLQASISNKILMNSKIKKKLFHLKVTRILLFSDASSAKIYKKIVSREANRVASQIQEDDELFQHPSSIIYLLSFFLGQLRFYFKTETQLSQSFQDSENSSSNGKAQCNSKQEIKTLTKSIIQLLNRAKCSKEDLQVLQWKIKSSIEQRAREIINKYDLIEGIPLWENFSSFIIDRCFQAKYERSKITNSTFNHWILDLKQRPTSSAPVSQAEQPGETKFFIPTILISPPCE